MDRYFGYCLFIFYHKNDIIVYNYMLDADETASVYFDKEQAAKHCCGLYIYRRKT